MSSSSGWEANEVISRLIGEIKSKEELPLLMLCWRDVGGRVGDCGSGGGKGSRHDVYIRSGLLRQAACERAVTHITQATCYLS